uniref:Innexin n=1 Tax=Meloidogyne incognita TaxID=6306 RepID=A0A914NEI7_MELIC
MVLAIKNKNVRILSTVFGKLCMFFITRFLYILNIIGQIRIMNHFLGQNTLFWGAHILSDVVSGRDWELSGNFPRVALCDFTVSEKI